MEISAKTNFEQMLSFFIFILSVVNVMYHGGKILLFSADLEQKNIQLLLRDTFRADLNVQEH